MNITYYAATSIDGYIATSSGGLDWLPPIQKDGEDFGYFAFFGSVDGLLVGRDTYDGIAQHGKWGYGRKPCWVWTTRPLTHQFDAEIIPTTATPQHVIAQAQQRNLSHLWLIGGGNLAAQFHAQRLINTFIVTLIPVLLGNGIPFLDGDLSAEPLTLTNTQNYASGVVQLTYQLATNDQQQTT